MTGRKTTIAILCSVALNLFLVGALAGVLVVSIRSAAGHPSGRQWLRGAAMSLTSDDRGRLFATLRGQATIVRPLAAQARDLRQGAWGQLGGATFDSTLVKATLARARALDQQARATVEDSVVDFAATLPQSERQTFTRSMQRALAGGERPGPRPHWLPIGR